MRAGDVIAAARGAALIVHAVNPPGYRDWDKLVLPMLDSTHRGGASGRCPHSPARQRSTTTAPTRSPMLDETSAQNPPSPARAPSGWRWNAGYASPRTAGPPF